MHPIFHISKLKKFPNVQLGDEVDDEEFFEIEDIVDVRTGVDGQSLYRVRWKGYGPQFDEWHTIDDLGDEAIIFAQNREAELRAQASLSSAPAPGVPAKDSKEPKPKKKKGKAPSSDEPKPNQAKEGSSSESESRQKRAEQRAAAKEARQVSSMMPVVLPARKSSRRRWRAKPAPSLKSTAWPKGVVCEGGVVRFLHDRA
jgi:hypothetical protein